ncbi:hypothetical protein NX059_004517 [Plenodomus lindquistii]|nr:hypothetical protein NX059_004517 [Plenodomus lindquistii]
MMLSDKVFRSFRGTGSEDEQEHQQSLCANFDSRTFWATQEKDPNAIRLAALKRQIKDDGESAIASTHASPPGQAADSRTSNGSKPFSMSGIDRQAMEQERLARQSKLKRKASPEPQPRLELFNFREGSHDAWQLGESVNDFVNRLPPDTTTISTCPWIWVENPHRDPRDKSAFPRVDHFTDGGMELLEQSLSTRQQIQANGAGVPKGMVMKSLIQEGKDLQQRIADLAVADHVLSGKWMLFPKSTDVNRIWSKVVQGVIDDRLGCTAKVATDDGADERLICVYTKDFRNVEDVSRVLAELEAMGLLHPARTIYYKPDAYTYLDIRSGTAAQYGLQASLYNSRTLMMTAKLPNSSEPQKKPVTLNRYF